ncbi:hypothetical protein [Vulcanisaeta sp. JCM 16159]|nr:hypothetical protein [Vulcanisaeta sp. JCM 16159]
MGHRAEVKNYGEGFMAYFRYGGALILGAVASAKTTTLRVVADCTNVV